MGLTAESTGRGAIDSGLSIQKQSPDERVTILAGNPNVGKSTLFNALTGLNQHTGNWPGKTVSMAQGKCAYQKNDYTIVDIPGTYSLLAHSAEEEVARNFICFGGADSVVVVCDATCLERNLNLVLQTIEITPHVIVCVNLLDEARKKHIRIDLKKLEEILGVPVVGTDARKGIGLNRLLEYIEQTAFYEKDNSPFSMTYTSAIEQAIQMVEPVVSSQLNISLPPRWVSLRLIDHDPTLIESLNEYLGTSVLENQEISDAILKAREYLALENISQDELQDKIVSCIVLTAEGICNDCVFFERQNYNERDRKIDRFLTSKWTGIPVMLLLLMVIFWLTITGANYPSQVLANALFWFGDRLSNLFVFLGAPAWLHGALVDGIYHVLAWIISVMLPPMAIFFPLFTLLEDVGYLPRVAFNLDKYFKNAHTCGKQALTMCMGFGCNAAGIIGCRIIDTPRERLIAMITNNFVPCNGRFPTLIAIITMFFVGSVAAPLQSLYSTLLLTSVIVLGVFMTFLISQLLSQTILKGLPSSFTLELPPYRLPQIGKVIIRSIFDRTIFVLGRAVMIAAPAGLIIWMMANITVGDSSILAHCSAFLDPFGRLIGLDGVILIAFILGFPANEIVVPIIIMAYLCTGSLTELNDLSQLKALLVANGWTSLTAICTMLFSLMHWPCSTTCLTIKKETQSVKWAVISFLVPTITGLLICFFVATTFRLLGLG